MGLEGQPLKRAGRKRSLEGAVSLIEGSLLLGVTGVLLASLLPTFCRDLHYSKHAEVEEMLTTISQSVATYYSATHGSRRYCLPASAGPSPATPSVDPVLLSLAATAPSAEVQTTDENEETVTQIAGTGADSWRALALEEERLLRFSYSFHPIRAGCGIRVEDEALFFVMANGDLDGDGSLSAFEQGYTVRAGSPVPVGPLHIRARME